MPSNKAVEAGRAVLRIVAVEEGVRGTLNEIEASLEKTAAKARNVGVAIAASGIAGLGSLGLAIREASRAEEIGSKFAVVFAEATGEMKSFFRTMSDEVGRSEIDLQDFGAGFQDLLQPIGFDPSSAREFSGVLTQLAIDLGSFNNRADTAVVRDLQAALTGSSETVKRYGVVVNEAAVKQELLNQAINPKSATDVDKVYARIAIILRQTTAAQGDAARTAGEVANQFKALSGRVRDASAAIGAALLPVIRPVLLVMNFLAEGVRNVAEVFPFLTVVVAGSLAIFTAFGIALSAAGIAAGFLLSPITLLSIVLFVLGKNMLTVTFATAKLIAAQITLAGTARAAAAAMGLLTTAARFFIATPIGAVITAVVVILPLLAGGFGLAASEARAAGQAMEDFAQSVGQITEAQEAAATLRSLAAEGKLSAEQMQQAEAALNELGARYGDIGIRADSASQSIDSLGGAFEQLDEKLKDDLISAKTKELQEAAGKIGDLERRLSFIFKLGSNTGEDVNDILDPLKKELEEAKKAADELRDSLRVLRTPDDSGGLTDSQLKGQDSFNDRSSQRLRDEEIANIEDGRTRRITAAEEAASREIAEAERVSGDKTLIEKRLALEVARINREVDARLEKESLANTERVAKEKAALQRVAEGFAGDRREAELRVALEGRGLELALLREQEQEKIKLARDRGIATLDIEREFAARRAAVNAQFNKQEKARRERDRKQEQGQALQLARSQEVAGTLATRVAGQQFSRGADRVAVDALQELRGINRRLGRIERQPGGIRVN